MGGMPGAETGRNWQFILENHAGVPSCHFGFQLSTLVRPPFCKLSDFGVPNWFLSSSPDLIPPLHFPKNSGNPTSSVFSILACISPLLLQRLMVFELFSLHFKFEVGIDI